MIDQNDVKFTNAFTVCLIYTIGPSCDYFWLKNFKLMVIMYSSVYSGKEVASKKMLG